MDKEFLIGLGIDESAAEAISAAARSELDEKIAEVTKDAEKQRLSEKYGHTLRRALERAGARNINAACAALGFEWDGEDFDDAPSGLGDAVDRLKRDEPYLFFGGDGLLYDPVPRCRFIGISPVESADDDENDGIEGELTYSEYVRRKSAR